MTAWKDFERAAGRLLGATRYWANSGESVDVEGPLFVGQCKLVKVLSLSALTKLAETAHRDGCARGKVGVVAVKLRAGRGNETPTLIVLHEKAWAELHGRNEPREG